MSRYGNQKFRGAFQLCGGQKQDKIFAFGGKPCEQVYEIYSRVTRNFVSKINYMTENSLNDEGRSSPDFKILPHFERSDCGTCSRNSGKVIFASRKSVLSARGKVSGERAPIPWHTRLQRRDKTCPQFLDRSAGSNLQGRSQGMITVTTQRQLLGLILQSVTRLFYYMPWVSHELFRSYISKVIRHSGGIEIIKLLFPAGKAAKDTL